MQTVCLTLINFTIVLLNRKDFDGCHVQKANNILDRKWYIVPLCSSCNQTIGTLNIGDIKMIPTSSNL